MTTHHPGDDLLAAYAAGDMAEAPALLIATHLALCPACRRQVADYEALGGELMAALPGEPPAPDSLARTLARLDAQDADEAAPVGRHGSSAAKAQLLPRPLRDYMAEAKDRSWRSIIPGLRTLSLKTKGAKTWLMELAPGRPIPDHGHRGQEMVLVLSGGYHDGVNGYGPGDVQISGPETIHRPVADKDGPCLCLVVAEGGIRPQNLLARLYSSLFGY
jgi:putative transcriptional regulator